MALKLTFSILFLALFLAVKQSSSQLRPQPGSRSVRNTVCLFRPFCNNPPDEEESRPSPNDNPGEPFPAPVPVPGDSPFPSPRNTKQVDLLNIAESCAANFITQDYNDGWEERRFSYDESSSIHWQVRLTNKLFVYLASFNMYESNGMDITEGQLEESACFQTKIINGWGITNTTGFGGKSMVLRLSRTTLPKVFRFSLPYGPIGASAGTASIILSDNFSYTVFEFCFDNGLRAFAMFTKGLITATDISSVKLHLKAIGFQDKHIIDLRPDDYCFAPLLLNPEFLNPRTETPRAASPNPNYIKFIQNNGLLPLPPFFWKKK